MQRVIVVAIHAENGEEYEWLLPDSLLEQFNENYKNAKHWDNDLLALVASVNIVSIVKIVDFYVCDAEDLLRGEHPYRNVIHTWIGFADEFIVGYKNIEDDEIDDLSERIEDESAHTLA